MNYRPQHPHSPERSVRERFLDELVDEYVSWREECVDVDASYRRWRDASTPDRPLRFAAYVAALDREEKAAREYGALSLTPP